MHAGGEAGGCDAATSPALRQAWGGLPVAAGKARQLSALSASQAKKKVPEGVTIIDGRKVASEWLSEIAEDVAGIQQRLRRSPGLSVILVGARADSVLYVNRKREAAAKVGIDFKLRELPEQVSQERLAETIQAEYDNPNVDGVLVQLPLPPHIDEELMLEFVEPHKDVDGLHPLNVGRLSMRGRQPAFVPCTPLGCIELLKRYGYEIFGKTAVVIGNSNTVGSPLSMLLRDAGAASVTICHCTASDFMANNGDTSSIRQMDWENSSFRAAGDACLPPLRSGGGSTGGGYRYLPASAISSIPDVCRNADFLFVAVGFPELVRKDWLKPGCVVVDVGINTKPIREDDDIKEISESMLAGGCNPSYEVKIVGDVAFQEVSEVVSAITPVPGGVGPMTIAALMENTLMSAKRTMDRMQWKLKESVAERA